MPDKSMQKVMAGVDETALKIAFKNQDKIKDYSSWREQHTRQEMIDGKKETIIISNPDIYGIREDIRKTPLNPKEHLRKK